MTQGVLGVGDLLLTFTLLNHTKKSEAKLDTLSMLRQASQRMK